MPFQIKDFASITAAQINHARAVTDKITDFLPGSVARTLMEAPAVEIEELYLQFFLGLRDAIPVATFQSFGFDKLPAALARGFVSVFSETPLEFQQEIPSGATFGTSDGRIYVSTESVTWPAGTSSVKIPVAYTVAGYIGNAAAGVINFSSSFSASAGYTVSNSAITSGKDAETDTEREARFADFVKSLSRGTVSACLYAAKQAVVNDEESNISEYVVRAGIVEQPGYVRIYLYSSAGLPSADLIAYGQKLIDGWKDTATGVVTPGYRSAGVRIDVLPMSERAISSTFSVGMLSGYTLTSAIRQSLTDVYATAIRAVQPGETLYLGTLVDQLLGVTGVLSVVPSGTQNIVCAGNEALVPGTVTFIAL